MESEEEKTEKTDIAFPGLGGKETQFHEKNMPIFSKLTFFSNTAGTF